MKTLIAGSRTITSMRYLLDALHDLHDDDYVITEVVSGGAPGVDRLGETWAHGNEIPIKRFIPDWKPSGIYNPRAGIERSAEMAAYADAAVILWDGRSTGTKFTLDEVRRLGIIVYAYRVGPQGMGAI